MRRIRKEAKKLVQLKREIRLIHKQSWTESGELGILGYRDGIKKVENIGEWAESKKGGTFDTPITYKS